MEDEKSPPAVDEKSPYVEDSKLSESGERSKYLAPLGHSKDNPYTGSPTKILETLGDDKGEEIKAYMEEQKQKLQEQKQNAGMSRKS
jgi:hypothetical protein